MGELPPPYAVSEGSLEPFQSLDLVASLGFSVGYRICTPKQAKVYVHRRCCFRETTGNHEHDRGNIVKELFLNKR